MTINNLTTSKTKITASYLITAMGLLSCLALPVAAESIGKVLLSVGKVEAQATDEVVRNLSRRSPIYTADTLVTYDDSKTQIRFTDGSMVSLAPNSVFKIQEYEYDEGQSEKAIYSLLKGGLQTLTGAIGHVKKQDYRLLTPLATIGIRGTFYQVFLTEDGSVVGFVKEGAIVITVEGAEPLLVPAGKYFSLDINGQPKTSDLPLKGFHKGLNKMLGQAGIKSGIKVKLEKGMMTIDPKIDLMVFPPGVEPKAGGYDHLLGGAVGGPQIDGSLPSGPLPSGPIVVP